MQSAVPVSGNYPEAVASGDAKNESASSGVSASAIIGGAFVAAALGMTLLVLGAGFGFAAVSPWSGAGASATAIGIGTIVWLLVTQAIAAGMGGYVAGRLRTKWVGVHTDEVFFRDTAHGFLVWAVAVVITGAFLTSAATSFVSGAAKVAAAGTVAAGAGVATGAGAAASSVAQRAGGATVAGGGSAAAGPSTSTDTNAYFVDALFRSDRPAGETADAALRGEVGRIFATGLRDGQLAQTDRTYVTQVVASRTGISPEEADKRVNETLTRAKAAAADAETKARAAADAARKAAAYASLWIFVALLIGAFAASYAATIGGRERDDVRA